MPDYRDKLINSNLVFDIETGPQAWGSIEKRADPFQPPKHPGVFDPSTVRCGGMKDPEKINVKIETARAAHQSAVLRYENDLKAAREAWKAKAIEDAPLDPRIAVIHAIGYRDPMGNVFINRDDDGGEVGLLNNFWSLFVEKDRQGQSLIGHFSRGFDVPFIMRRSWILGIDTPNNVRNSGRYLSSVFVDTRELWLCGNSNCVGSSSLDSIARAMGLGQKPDDMTGADFWNLWQSGDEEQRARALDYLANDLSMCASIAERMGVL